MERHYDLVVVGTGIASGVASRCREAGWTVAVVDSRPFGGTCALRGCVPKKILVSAAEAVHAARDMDGIGVPAGALGIDWPQLMKFKRSLVDPTPERTAQSWAKIGVDRFHGRARFVAPTTLAVGDDRLVGRRVLIAAGAMPVPLKFPGAERLTTSEQFLNLDSLPRSVAFVGGGYISFEFAHVAARAGARVTILHRDARPLAEFDPGLVERLTARTRALGVHVRLGTEARAIQAIDGRYRVTADGTPDARTVMDTDLVVHGAGRVPDVDELALDAGGVRYSRAGVEVNPYLQSVSNPIVYAAGDCAATDGPALTPVAAYEGRIVATNLLEGNHTTPSYDAIPSVVFTLPPLARVGLQESDAQAAGLRFVTHHEDTRAWYSSRRLGEECSAFKVLIEQDSRRIVGAHLLGPHADETINLFALGMRTGTTVDRFKELLWAYPT